MEIGASYRLGFTIAKISWYFGGFQERKNLISQAELFSSRIGFPKKKLKKALSKLKENKIKEKILENARAGLDVRNTLSIEIDTFLGGMIAAAFRFGFNIIYICPQLEFMEMSRQAGLPYQQLYGPIFEQIRNLVKDGKLIKIGDDELTKLANIQPESMSGDRARQMFIDIGIKVDQSLNQ